MKKLIYLLMLICFLAVGIQACNEPVKEPVKVEKVAPAQDCPQPEPQVPKGKNGFYDCVDGKWVFVEDIGRSGKQRDTVIIDSTSTPR